MLRQIKIAWMTVYEAYWALRFASFAVGRIEKAEANPEKEAKISHMMATQRGLLQLQSNLENPWRFDFKHRYKKECPKGVLYPWWGTLLACAWLTLKKREAERKHFNELRKQEVTA